MCGKFTKKDLIEADICGILMIISWICIENKAPDCLEIPSQPRFWGENAIKWNEIAKKIRFFIKNPYFPIEKTQKIM